MADPGLVVCDSDDSDLEAADPDPPGPEPSGLCPSQMERELTSTTAGMTRSQIYD